MKKLIYILLFSILSIASYGQTCVATGTTKAGKLGMCSPSLGTASDSVVVWNATGERLLKYIPRSSFNELTADELAAIQNANAPNAGNPFATMDDVVHPSLQQVTDAGNSTTGDIFVGGQIVSGDSVISGSGSNQAILNPDGTLSLISNNVNAIGQISSDNLTSPNTKYQLPEKGGVAQTFAMRSDITGFGTGTVTSVTGTNGVTVANGTSTPVIGLGNITPTKVNGITLSGSSTPALAVTGTASVSGANTGDQDLSTLELKANKQNSLAADGTGNKYITVDAVRKLTAFVNLEIFFFQASIDDPTISIVNNPTTATITSTRTDSGDYKITSNLPIFSGNCWPGNDPGVTLVLSPYDAVAGPSTIILNRISDYEYRVRTSIDIANSFSDAILVEPILLTIKIPY